MEKFHFGSPSPDKFLVCFSMLPYAAMYSRMARPQPLTCMQTCLLAGLCIIKASTTQKACSTTCPHKATGDRGRAGVQVLDTDGHPEGGLCAADRAHWAQDRGPILLPLHRPQEGSGGAPGLPHGQGQGDCQQSPGHAGPHAQHPPHCPP